MKKRILLPFVALLALGFGTVYGQEERLGGLWLVEQVVVGNETMTPVAKWFRIEPDGTYQAGNGWLQNNRGTWSYNADKNLYTAEDTLDVADEMGGFEVHFQDEKMVWKRQEEGVQVSVILRHIEALPMAPADLFKGMWELVAATDNEESTEAKYPHKLHIRWDRIYRSIDPEGKRTSGYWHMHGHKAEVTLLPRATGESPTTWHLEVNEKELVMKGISANNQGVVKTYRRVRG